MLGYWNDTQKTAEAVVDGWMHTGDLGRMDEEGYITIVGRSKDMVIRGGENIFPIEIENYPIPPPQNCGCTSGRRRSCLWRSVGGLDYYQTWANAHRRRREGILPQPHRPLQNSHLYTLC